MHEKIYSGLLALLILSNANVWATVRVPALFSDHMVLQRGIAINIWGWADTGEKITVKFRNQKASTVATNGKWNVKLSSMEAGGPDVLQITGGNTIELKDVLVGDVWVCGGQSNMEWPLQKSFEPLNAIAASSNSNIRLFMVPNVKATNLLDDVDSKWTTTGPETTPGFSAVAYFFGRDLQKSMNVPIGLIQSDWGGSPAEVWMSESALARNPRYQTEILHESKIVQEKHQAALAKFNADDANKGKPAPHAPWRPSELYNGMIAPIIHYPIKGAIWYQGESNADRAHQYRALFPDLIRDWRAHWDQGDFPFLAVQLAPFHQIKAEPGDSTWAELREAQLNATKVLPNVAVAVITDVGDEKDIHPSKKEPVGQRLALAARRIAYEERIVHTGPIYKKMKVKGGKARVSFENIGGGLEARGGALKGFAIAGEDKKFVWALAEIDGDKVVVSSPKVEKPVAVRYGWADFPVVNLWNKEGLPASPFRTDNFPMITAPKE